MERIKQTLLKWLDAHEEDTIRMAKDLIGIPTVSTLPDANERYDQINQYFIKKCEGWNLPWRTYTNGPDGGPNLICTKPGAAGGRSLAVGGHSDVVPADETDWVTGSGFDAKVIDGKLYGRGAADMKCGLAAGFMALRALVENSVSLRGDFRFVSSVDEEVGGVNGMKFLAESGALKTDYLINAEQTNMNVMTAYKGTCYIEVTVMGKPAHGSTPQLGVNAIENAGKLIYLLRTLGLDWAVDPMLGRSTMNFGLISGGVARNVVADTCKFAMDIRLVRGMTAEDALENIRAIIRKLSRNDPDFQAAADFMARYTRPTVVGSDNPLVQVLLNNNKIVGQPSECRSFISPGDCWHFLKDGVTALMCGPGCLDDIHRSNEYAYVSEVTAAAKVYTLSAIDLCGLA